MKGFLALFFSGQCLALDPIAATRLALPKAVELSVSQPRAPLIDRGTLLRPPVIGGVRMSPDGRYLSFLRWNGQGADLWLLEVRNGKQVRLLVDVKGAQHRWSGDGTRLWMYDKQGLAVISPATRKAKRILKWNASRRQIFFAVDPNAPAYALVAERVEQNQMLRYRYLTVDDSGNTRLLHEATLPLRKVLLREDGTLAFAAAFDGPEYDTVIRRYTKQGATELARCRGMEVCELLGYSGEGDLLWMLAHSGEDKISLQRWQAGQEGWKTVHRDPAGIADAEALIWNRGQANWQAIAYYGDNRRWYGNSAGLKSQLAALKRHLPDANLRLTHANDGRIWLVEAEQSDWTVTRHFLYEPGSDRLQPLFVPDDERLSAPSPHQLAAARPISWRARDGMILQGYVYLPRGVAPGNAPLITWLHGGPFTRLYDDYDPRIQLLANRGYVVFLPNFRASTGFGLRYQRASNGDVGNGKVLWDVIDGLDFLLANGIGDRNLQAVAGHSFGGYLSLLAVSHYPERFRFAFAGAPPTDYGWAKQWQVDNESESLRGNGPPVELSFPQHGLPFADPSWRKKMERESPLTSVSKLRASVYLWAGAHDDRTPVKSVAHYAAEATRNGKEVVLLIDTNAGHTPVDPLGDEAWVFLLESAAHRHFAGGLTPASPQLKKFIRKHLAVDTPRFLQ